ncbi:hypothetical protein [Candidatus Phytoplasma pini]|uniref:Uncharacterized protein n=1 Tax=Candidatus Phytoplasma pini TaxID=267362 RepID=A0A559KJA1_9MOLU|nr:hypothetical protein [Candidatus Phytoplasma pini]TVY12206.1 hypothetical protein MDPP_00274 [Candidatus Phytoplasma pini]
MMAWHNETYLIGERIKVQNRKDIGVVTRIDFKNGCIYVLFKRTEEKRMEEVVYRYPEDLNNNILKPLVLNKKLS